MPIYRHNGIQDHYDWNTSFREEILNKEIDIEYVDNPSMNMRLKFKDFLDLLYDMGWEARALNSGQVHDDYYGVLECIRDLYKCIHGYGPYRKKAIPKRITFHDKHSVYKTGVMIEPEEKREIDYSADIDAMCRMVDEIDIELDSIGVVGSFSRFFGKKPTPRFNPTASGRQKGTGSTQKVIPETHLTREDIINYSKMNAAEQLRFQADYIEKNGGDKMSILKDIKKALEGEYISKEPIEVAAKEEYTTVTDANAKLRKDFVTAYTGSIKASPAPTTKDPMNFAWSEDKELLNALRTILKEGREGDNEYRKEVNAFRKLK